MNEHISLKKLFLYILDLISLKIVEFPLVLATFDEYKNEHCALRGHCQSVFMFSL